MFKMIRKKNLFIIIPIFLLLSIVRLFPEDCIRGSFFIKNYTPEEYGGFPQVWAVARDKRGIMYFGNSSGVIEFDGVNWNIIKMKNNNTIRSIAVDSKGVVYIGAIGDFGYLSFDKNGTLFFKSIKPLLKNSVKHVNNVFEVFTISSGVYFIEEDKVFRYYNNKIEILPVKIRSKGIVIDNVIYVQDNRGIKMIYDNKIIPLPETDIFNLKNAGRALLLPYDKTKMLILSEKKGSFIYELNAFKNLNTISSKKTKYKTKKLLKRFKTDIDSYIKRYGVYTGKKLNNNLYAIAPFEGGIILMNKKGKIVNVINESSGLQNNIVFDMYIDANNNIWTALNNGIAFIEAGSPITFFGKSKGLKNLVLDMVKYHNKMYVSSMDGLHYLPKCKNYNMFAGKGFKKGNGQNFSLFDLLIYKNILMAGSYGGVFYYNKNSLKHLIGTRFVYVLEISNRFPDKIFVGKRGGLSILSVKLIGKKLKVVEYKIKEIKDIIRGLKSDYDGNIWVSAQNNGLFYIRFSENNILDYKIYKIKAGKGLPEPNSAFAYNVNGEIVIVNSKQFYKAKIPAKNNFNMDNLKFVKYKELNNLINDSSSISLLENDNKGNIIVGMSDRFGIIRKRKNGEMIFDDKPFVKIKEYVTSIFIENNVKWIGTTKGVYKFDETYKKIYNKPFNSIIRKVVINNKENKIYENYYKIQNGYKIASLKQPDFLIPTLNYSNNSLYFEFAATFYEHSDYNKFSYKLEGYDKKWSPWVSFHKKEYTNLPAGDYVFKVKAKNIFGIESPTAKFGFIILPPWYMTIYAYIGYFLLSGLFIYILLWFNSRRHKKARDKLEIIIKERTAIIKEQNRKLKELATHDGLTGLFNKRKFEELYDREWRRAVRNKTPIGIIMIDIDYFKLYNDSYGHQAGDICLKKVAETISNTVNRPGDAVARYGGEEFIVLLSETDEMGVTIIAERIRKRVENMRMVHEKSKVSDYITISLGCSVIIPDTELSPSVLIKKADDALYESKEHGRNRVTFKKI
jgi:diguanylate cyclase (GGDEF)-like protein